MSKNSPRGKTSLGSGPVAVPLLTPDQIHDLVMGLSPEEMDEMLEATDRHKGNPIAFCAAVTDWFQKRGVVAGGVA